MKQNITLSLKKELIKKGRIIAAQNETSLNRMLSEKLEETIRKAEEYNRAKKRALANLKSGFHLGGKIRASREELHER
jgi:hypothetical protein